MKQQYTLCFLFDFNGESMLTIRKTKPAWQAGFLNAIGGKVEAEESVVDCAIREFKEETGLGILWSESDRFAILQNDEFEIHCFAQAVLDGIFASAKTRTDEEVFAIKVKEISDSKCVHNLPWLSAMAYRAMCRQPFDESIYRIVHEKSEWSRDREGVG